MNSKRLLSLLLAVGVVVIAAAPVPRWTRPVVRCSLPDRDYRFQNASQPVRAVSAEGVLAREPLALPDGDPDPRLAQLFADPRLLREVRRFEFVRQPRLEIHHCSLSKMSLLLFESGEWTLSLRADQNPLAGELSEQERNVTSGEDVRLFTDHLQRNRFFVTVRCYAGYGTGGESGLVGRPVVVPLEIEPFWVQRGKPYYLHRQGHDPRIRDWYAEIDRVELEFHYR